jgi:threonine/homoserine/homoserine lactone efflux protein
MDTTLVAAFLAAAIPTFFTPGPNNLMLMASTAKFGFRPTIPHALGVSLGFPVMVFVLGLGLSEVFHAWPWLKPVLKAVAVVNFLWLAWTLLGLKVGSAEGSDRPLRFYEAAVFQWINPKAWAMAISFIALVVDEGPNRAWTLALLTIGCIALAPFSTVLWMFFGQQLDRLLKRTGTERYLGMILAGLMIVAVVLFLI